MQFFICFLPLNLVFIPCHQMLPFVRELLQLALRANLMLFYFEGNSLLDRLMTVVKCGKSTNKFSKSCHSFILQASTIIYPNVLLASVMYLSEKHQTKDLGNVFDILRFNKYVDNLGNPLKLLCKRSVMWMTNCVIIHLVCFIWKHQFDIFIVGNYLSLVPPTQFNLSFLISHFSNFLFRF